MSRVLLDLSQLIGSPARSGIQRVICEMVSRWRQDMLGADVGFLVGKDYCTVELRDAALVLGELFNSAGQLAVGGAIGREMADLLMTRQKRRVESDDVFDVYDGYFLPELTFRDDILDRVELFARQHPSRVLALFYDALPQTAPAAFMAAHQLATSRYFRVIAGLENVACISRAAYDCLTGRLRRRRPANGAWFELGADGLGERLERRVPSTPTFLMLGTVEPRKNHAAVLAAFDELWARGRDYRLVVIGAPGAHDPAMISRLRSLAGDGTGRLTWLEAADDLDIRRALSTATAAIFISEFEGYGLPAVEALAAGCPLIAHRSLPALSGRPADGQMRLDALNAETIAAAIEELANPARSDALAAAVAALSLPEWDQFTRSLLGWMNRTLAAAPHAVLQD